MTPTEILKSIKPGKNYPSAVEVIEQVDGEEMKIKFLLQSYVVGMYCEIYTGNYRDVPHQTGDHNNKGFVTKLKKDLAKAIERGATLKFGSILSVKTMEPKQIERRVEVPALP